MWKTIAPSRHNNDTDDSSDGSLAIVVTYRRDIAISILAVSLGILS